MKKYLGLLVVILVVLPSCVEKEQPTVDSARLDLLEHADINIDGWPSDWGGIDPIYKDSEKSMFAVIDGDSLVLRISYVSLNPLKETYFLGLDTDFDDELDYTIKVNKDDAQISGEEIEILALAGRTIEIAIPRSLCGNGCFLTGWVYNDEIGMTTAHFPWIRSLEQDTGFDPELTRNEWKEEFEALYYLVKYNYPYLWVKERTHGYNWLDLKDEYMQRLNEIETNEEFLSLMREAVATLQNGHTGILDPKWIEKWGVEENNEASKYWKKIWNYSCPEVFFSYIGGKYIASDGLGDWKEKYGIEEGAKVIEINGKNVDDAVESVKTEARVLYDCDRDKLFMRYMDPEVFGKNTTFTIKKANGTEVKKIIECVSKDPYDEYFQSDAPNLEFKRWKEKKVAYMKVRSFGVSSEDVADWPEMREFYKMIQGYNTLIIDIRGNGGGRPSYWQDSIVRPLTKKDIETSFFIAYRQGNFARRGESYSSPKENYFPPEIDRSKFGIRKLTIHIDKTESYTFKRDIYLLVDRRVYSGAERFAVFAKASGFATLVGTTTGGDYCGPNNFVLPNSKLSLRIATQMGLNPDGTANEETHTSPDIYIEQEYGGGDEVLAYVLELIEG